MPLPAVETPKMPTQRYHPFVLWDVDKEQLVKSISSPSDCSVTALALSQDYADQLAAGFVDSSVRLYDIQTPDMLVWRY